MTQQPTEKNAHGCRYQWCENTADRDSSEHFQIGVFVPVTGKSLDGIGYTDRDLHGEALPTFGVGVRFNEDLEPAPKILFNVYGGHKHIDVDYLMQLDEAVLFYNALGEALRAATAGRKFSPRRVTAFYNSGEDR